MDNEKIGKFIKKLREEKKWSQQKLADELYVTQQAVSSWEKGKFIPDIEKIKLMSNIFKVPVSFLLAGEVLNTEKEKDEIIYKAIKDKQQKIKKISLIFIITISSIFILFLIYYFVNSYRSTKVYVIHNDSGYIETEGVMIISKSKAYFSLSINKMEIKELRLLYNDEVIYLSNDKDINFKDAYGYNEYINFDKLNDFIENLYLEIIDVEDKTYNVKLVLKKDFENSDLLFIEENNVSEQNDDFSNNNIPPKIIKKFTFEKNDNYYYHNIKQKDSEINLLFWGDSMEFWVEEKKTNSLITWKYYLNDKSIYYEEQDLDGNIINSFFGNYNNTAQDDNTKLMEEFMTKYIKEFIER